MLPAVPIGRGCNLPFRSFAIVSLNVGGSCVVDREALSKRPTRHVAEVIAGEESEASLVPRCLPMDTINESNNNAFPLDSPVVVGGLPPVGLRFGASPSLQIIRCCAKCNP